MRLLLPAHVNAGCMLGLPAAKRGKEEQGCTKIKEKDGKQKRRICESRKVVREENGKKLFSFLAPPHLAKGGCMNKKLASRCYFHLKMLPSDRKSGKSEA